MVRLPFNDKKSELGESYGMALKQYLRLERNLSRNESVREQSTDFIEKYKMLGHMSLTRSKKEKGYFIPHHAVLKKFRVVFNASSKTTTGVSLNDALMNGPLFQQELLAIVIRFFVHEYVIMADAEKMYHEILIHPDDPKFQKILWRSSETKKIAEWEVNTVTYGESPSSYMATRPLLETTQNFAIDKSHEQACKSVKSDFYIDDLLEGADSLEDALKLRDKIIEITASGGFKLRKWASNDQELLRNLSVSANENVKFDWGEEVKVLGIY